MTLNDHCDRKREWAKTLPTDQAKAWLDFFSRWFATEEFLIHGRKLGLWDEE